MTTTSVAGPPSAAGSPVVDATAAPLAGFTIAVTAARRADELGTALERRGATVLQAPAIRLLPLADDVELLAATRTCVEQPPDVVIATTGIGFRGWMEAADGWGLGDDLLAAIGRARLMTRGPKAKGAVRAAGLREEWSPPSESSSEVLDHLLEGDLRGARVAVQLHGEPLRDVVDALRAAGAEVVEVPVYRWLPAEDLAPLRKVVDATARALVDAVTFTSAPAAASFLQQAEELGRTADVVRALSGPVLAACVGPVTAGPLERAGVPTVQPDRARLGALVRSLAAVLPERSRPLTVAEHVLEVRAGAAVVDGVVVPLQPAAAALLRALARQPGRVVAREELLAALPGEGTDGHAVEVAVGRLRTTLGHPGLVQTVVKRGYRLAYDPEAVGTCRT